MIKHFVKMIANLRSVSPPLAFFTLVMTLLALRFAQPRLELYARDYLDSSLLHHVRDFAKSQFPTKFKNSGSDDPHGALISFDEKTTLNLGRNYLKRREVQSLLMDLNKVVGESLLIETSYVETEKSPMPLANLDDFAPQSSLNIVYVPQELGSWNDWTFQTQISSPGQLISEIIRRPYDDEHSDVFIEHLPFENLSQTSSSLFGSAYLSPTIIRGQRLSYCGRSTNNEFPSSFSPGVWASPEKKRVLLAPGLAALPNLEISPGFIQAGERIIELDDSGRIVVSFLEPSFFKSKFQRSLDDYFNPQTKQGFLNDLKGVQFAYLQLNPQSLNKNLLWTPYGLQPQMLRDLSFLEGQARNQHPVPIRHSRIIIGLSAIIALTLVFTLNGLGLMITGGLSALLWLGLSLYFWMTHFYVFPVFEPLFFFSICAGSFYYLRSQKSLAFLSQNPSLITPATDLYYFILYLPASNYQLTNKATSLLSKKIRNHFKEQAHLTHSDGSSTSILTDNLELFLGKISQIISKELNRASIQRSPPLQAIYLLGGDCLEGQDSNLIFQTLLNQEMPQNLTPFSITTQKDSRLGAKIAKDPNWRQLTSTSDLKEIYTAEIIDDSVWFYAKDYCSLILESKENVS